MRVLITGGAGHIGKTTSARLIAAGWDVRIVSIEAEPPNDVEGAEYFQCDILDYDALLGYTRGCDAVIHLAALRSPNLAPGPQMFSVNVAGTYNVFEAAAVCGIKRVVQASSINAIGGFYGLGDFKPRYFPIDEDHPPHTTDVYSFSKQLDEEIGAYYWRRDGISSTALRFPGVYGESFIESGFLERRARAHAVLEELLALPDAEQRARLADVRERVLEYRALRPFEYGANAPGGMRDDPLFNMYAYERFNFWAFIDERDAAQSLDKALTAGYDGAHPLFVNDSHNALGFDSRTLIRLFFPDVIQLKDDLRSTESLVSIQRARDLIDFEPEHSVQDLGQP